MRNYSASLPRSWIRKNVKKNGAEVMCYANVLTEQCFYTKEDLDRYVDYVKRDRPEIYDYWGNGKKAVGATNSVSRDPITLLNGQILRLEGTSKHLKEGTSKGPREGASKHHREGTFKHPRDREKSVSTTSSGITTVPNAIIEDTMPVMASRVLLPKAGIYAVYMRKKWRFSKSKPHDPFKNSLLANRNLSVSLTRGMANGVDATSSTHVLVPGASASPERANAGDGESVSFDEAASK